MKCEIFRVERTLTLNGTPSKTLTKSTVGASQACLVARHLLSREGCVDSLARSLAPTPTPCERVFNANLKTAVQNYVYNYF
jgi:hypothetical protein